MLWPLWRCMGKRPSQRLYGLLPPVWPKGGHQRARPHLLRAKKQKNVCVDKNRVLLRTAMPQPQPQEPPAPHLFRWQQQQQPPPPQQQPLDCAGGSICQRKRRRSQCKDCGGSSICPHKQRRSTCIECGGSQVCVDHKRLKRECVFCPPAKSVCAKHARVLYGWNGRKCRMCEKKAPATRWMHTVYDRDGKALRRFYEDEEIAAWVARGEDLEDVRARMFACRGKPLFRGW